MQANLLNSIKAKVLSKGFLTPFASLILVFIVSGIFLAAVGYSPIEAYSSIILGAFAGPARIADTLGTATPIILTGLAVAVAMRGGVLNIGCEGQLYMGAFAAAIVGAHITGLPAIIHVPLCIIMAMLFGGLWALLAGWLKVRLGTNEVVVTILLNYIAIYLTDYLTNYWFKAEGMVVKTDRLQESAQLAELYPHSRLTTAFILVVVIAGLLTWMFRKTLFGLEITAMGKNLEAAQTGGINVNKCFLQTMLLSGALAGLAGAVEVMGVHNYFISGMSPGYGYDGLSIAVLGANNPIGTTIYAIVYGALRSGASVMDRNTEIPSDFVTIIQALIIVFVATPAIVQSIGKHLKIGKKTNKGGN